MAVYHKKQEICEHSTINTKGFCIHSFWHERACYCKDLQGGKIKALVRCPYAWRDTEDG